MTEFNFVEVEPNVYSLEFEPFSKQREILGPPVNRNMFMLAPDIEEFCNLMRVQKEVRLIREKEGFHGTHRLIRFASDTDFVLFVMFVRSR